MHTTPYHHHQAGFTLLEVLLATAILGGLMVATVTLTTSWSEQERAQIVGQQLEQITDSLEEYVQTVQPAANNTNDILAAWPDLETLLNQNGTVTSTRIGGEFKIAERSIGGVRTFAIYTTQPAKFSLVAKAARAAGSHAGYVGFQRGSFQAESAYNMWGLSTTDINNLFGLNTATPLISSPSDNTQGYLVAVLRMPEVVLTGPYLYRSAGSSDAQRTMQANLIMAGNDISGVNALGTNSLSVDSSANIGGDLTVTGSSTLAGNVSANNNLTVAQDTTIGGNANVTGNITASNVTATGDISANTITAQTSASSPLIKGDNLQASGNMSAANIIATDTVSTPLLTAQNVTASGFSSTGGLETPDLNVTNRLTIDQEMIVNGDTQLNGNVVIDDCLKLNGDSYGGAGC